jgi:hypothetical protein
VGSTRIGGVWFQIYSGDHAGATIPHVHAKFGEGEVVIELFEDRTVAPSSVHKIAIDPPVKKSDVRKALRIAAKAYDDLLKLWEESRP